MLATRMLAASALVATLDGLYVVAVFAWLLDMTTGERLFQGIALAMVGREAALAGESHTVLLGVVIHALVSLAWTAAWVIAYVESAALRRAVRSTRGAIVAGAAYGVVIHLPMQWVVLPVTHAVTAPLLAWPNLLVLLAHVLVVGPPIALLVRHNPRPGSA